MVRRISIFHVVVLCALLILPSAAALSPSAGETPAVVPVVPSDVTVIEVDACEIQPGDDSCVFQCLPSPVGEVAVVPVKEEGEWKGEADCDASNAQAGVGNKHTTLPCAEEVDEDVCALVALGECTGPPKVICKGLLGPDI